MSDPVLKGVRVLEIGGGIPVAFAARWLAGFGADVVRLDPAEESLTTDEQVYLLAGKRRVAPTSDPRALALAADIVIEGDNPGDIVKHLRRVQPEALRARKPGLVVVSITPFGQDGPWAQYKSSDLVGLALGGPMMMNGYDPEDAPGAPPIRGHGDQGYNTACHYAAHGILAALLYRDRTGRGQYVDCSMHEALSCTVEVGMPYYLYAREDVVRQTARHASARRTERWLVHAADGRDLILFGIGRDNSSWRKLKQWFQSFGFGMNFDEERFDSPASRQPGRGSAEASEVYAEVARFVASQPGESVYRGGQERDQAWGTVRSPEETLEDQHFWDRGHFVKVTGEDVTEPAAMPGPPYWFSATPWELRRPAPKLGEHTGELRASLV